MSGRIPSLLGNRHANIVPYQTFKTKDGEMVIAVGNDNQFKSLCNVLNTDYYENSKFKTNPDRVKNRDELTNLLQQIFLTKPTAYWIDKCRKNNIPCGPIQNLQEVTEDPQLWARNMFVEMEHPTAGKIKMIGSPIKLSRTPVTYRHHPPDAGEHNDLILSGIKKQIN